MSPLLSVGLATAALAEKITARYRVQTDNATTVQDGGKPPVTSAPPRVTSVSGASTPTRGGTLDVSV